MASSHLGMSLANFCSSSSPCIALRSSFVKSVYILESILFLELFHLISRELYDFFYSPTLCMYKFDKLILDCVYSSLAGWFLIVHFPDVFCVCISLTSDSWLCMFKFGRLILDCTLSWRLGFQYQRVQLRTIRCIVRLGQCALKWCW